jgi:hypothetical protein
MWISTYGQLSGLILLAVAANTAARHYGAEGVLLLYMLNVWLSLGVMLFVLSTTLRSVRLSAIGFYALELVTILAAAIALEHFVGLRLVTWNLMGQAQHFLILGFRSGIIACGFVALAWLARVPEAIEGFEFLNWQVRAVLQWPRTLWYAGGSEESLVAEESKETR